MSAATSSTGGAVVDANLWVARVLPNDRFYHASSRWLNTWLREGHGIRVPTLLLSELSGSLARRTGVPEIGMDAIADLVRIPRLRLVAIDESLAQDAARLAATLHLRGADAVYVALAAQLNIPLVTWDTELFKRAAAVIDARTPPLG